MNTKTDYLNGKATGFSACNEILDQAAQSVRSNPQAPVALPWMGGPLGVESKILLCLAQRYGAMGVASKGEGAQRKYKFYYSRESTGNWFSEVWPLWKVSAWFVALVFFAIAFMQMKVGAGCLVVGLLSLLVFGPRAVGALRNAVIAGKLSGYSYARESYPMLVAGSVIGVVLIEWAYVLPWNAGKAVDLVEGVAGLLLMRDGLLDFLYRLAKIAFTIGVLAVASVLAFQVAGVTMMRKWLEVAYRDGFVFAQPESGTWFNKLMVTGSNPLAGLFMFAFVILAVGSMAVPLMK